MRRLVCAAVLQPNLVPQHHFSRRSECKTEAKRTTCRDGYSSKRNGHGTSPSSVVANVSPKNVRDWSSEDRSFVRFLALLLAIRALLMRSTTFWSWRGSSWTKD